MKGHGTSHFDGLDALCRAGHKQQRGDRFGRIFKAEGMHLDGDVLQQLGEVGGPMDSTDGPNAKKPSQQRTKSVPVGFVFFGQFVDHDITLDVSSTLDGNHRAGDIANARTPTLDLDCVYGSGHETMPFMYSQLDGPYKGAKLVTATELGKRGHEANDVPRVNNVALIGDFRNDENRIVSQLQLAMIRYHNAICEDLHTDDPSLEGAELFEAARSHCVSHYHWAILHDFLPAMCGAGVVDRILAHGRQHYTPKGEPFIPVEFSVAAYRFGHGMAPQKLTIRSRGKELPLFGDKLGSGFSPVPGDDAVVDWAKLLDVPSSSAKVQMADRCAPLLAPILLKLPAPVDGEMRSLATRNLMRGQSFLLPSGEVVAERMGIDDAHIAKVTKAANKASGGLLHNGTPLWFYILTEADVIGREDRHGKFEPGEGLGPVGATIVAEVLIGLMQADPRSWLHNNRSWQATKGQRTVGELLTYADPEADEILDVRFTDGTAKRLA